MNEVESRIIMRESLEDLYNYYFYHTIYDLFNFLQMLFLINNP